MEDGKEGKEGEQKKNWKAVKPMDRRKKKDRY